MEESKQEEYYQMAIDWVNDFMEKNEPMIDFVSFDNIVITNSHNTLLVWVARLQLSKNREKHASFIKIKRFKDWYNEQHNETN
jgi:hypothetical protein